MVVTSDTRIDALTDRELAGLVTDEGDEIAFRCLYRRHTPAVYAFVRRMLGGRGADADDVVQDAWIRAVRGLPGFRWESSLRSWLTGIALNRTRELLRRQGRLVFRAEIDIPGAATPDPGNRLDVERALEALPAGYRTVLLLHDVEGFTHPEISDRLDIAVGTSKSQLFHARRALRRLLGTGERDDERHATRSDA